MASWNGFLSLGGVELANEERLRTYFENLWPGGPVRLRELEPVAGLHLALGDSPYTDPASDSAPWFDANNAVSEEFLGLRIQEIIGLDDAMDEAEVIESIGYGGTIGEHRVGTREIRVKGVLHGLTPEGVQLGMTWLRRVIWQQWGERLLAPQQPGVSDLRFFVQKPEIPDQLVNRIANPDGSDLGESLVGTAGTARVFRVPVTASDDWAYRILARGAGLAEAQLQPLERARTTPGQQWVARARIWRDASMLGARVINLLLRFRDQNGSIITAVGPDDTQVTDGVLYRWTGARWDSTSQMLTQSGMTTNWVVNPNGNGIVLGIAPYAGSPARAVMVGNPGKRNYRVTANTTGDAAMQTGLAPVRAGEQWWGRAAVSLAKASGARHLRADLVFFDRRNKVVSTTKGTQLDLVPAGMTHAWTGKRGASTSEQITGDTRRINYATNPNPRTSLAGYGARGQGTSIALERFTGFGTPFVVRCTLGPVPNANGAVGFDIPVANIPVGTTVYVTFWSIGQPSLRLHGLGWTGPNGEASSAGVAFVGGGSSPKRISIRVKITSKTQRFSIIRSTAVTGSFRIGRIGVLTDSDAYFDGDTGRYEWEGKVNESSSLAHLPGDYDLYNIPWNPTFTIGTRRWSSGQSGVAIGWDKGTKRMNVVTSASGIIGNMAVMDMWPALVGGQKISGGMTVYNTSGSAASVAARITTQAGTNIDGATVSVPAGGSAWVSLNNAGLPSGTTGGSFRLVSKAAIASGVKLQVDGVFFGSVPTGATLTQGMAFDGSTPATNGPAYVTGANTISVGAVAPEGATSVRLVIVRTSQGATRKDDLINTNRLMLTQVDPYDADVDDDIDPVAVLPAYFDGDYTSTFDLFPTFEINSSVDATENDTERYDAVITGKAPRGAVTAEIAIARTTSGAPSASDVIYADDLMLATYDEDADVPDYTGFTRRDLVADDERWVREVGGIAGPTQISQQLYGPNGCNGATQEVEFTIVAQQPEHVYDRGDRVRLPLPSSVTAGGSGAGTFARLEDTAGVVKNYMPQFDPNSSLIPRAWITTAPAGSVTTAGVRLNDRSPYVIRITQGSGTSTFAWQDMIQNALGDSGGWSSAVASVYLGGSVGGKAYTVTLIAFKGATEVARTSVTVTPPAAANGDILQDANRVNLTMPAAAANGAANGFAIRVDGPAGFGVAFIGIPQVTLTSTQQAMIYGGLADDGTYTYDFDGTGYSRRRPTTTVESHTIFANRTAPPAPRVSPGAYDEVGQTTFRTFAAIDTELVPRNAVAVPTLRVDFERFVTRWCRVRFYPNPLNLAPEAIDTGSFEHEWVIDQVWGNIAGASVSGFTSILIDGVAERVWLRAWDGTVISGDQYVVTGNGTPISWPEFKDIPWVVSVDYPTFVQNAYTPANESWWRPSLALMIKE